MSWCERIASGEAHHDNGSSGLPDGLPCRTRPGDARRGGSASLLLHEAPLCFKWSAMTALCLVSRFPICWPKTSSWPAMSICSRVSWTLKANVMVCHVTCACKQECLEDDPLKEDMACHVRRFGCIYRASVFLSSLFGPDVGRERVCHVIQHMQWISSPVKISTCRLRRAWPAMS
jgi:hypothetical protein